MNLNSCVKGQCWPLTYRWLIMTKLALFLVFGMVLQASAGAFGQQVTLKANRTPLNQVMKSVQEQTGYLYLFKGRELAHTRVTADVRQAALEAALEQVLSQNGFEWSINGKTIVIRPLEQTSKPSAASNAGRQQTATGTVRDEYGNPVAGATVTVKGTGRATATDDNGAFSIAIDGSNQLLVVSLLGFTAAEVVASGAAPLSIVLESSVSDLDEVIVIGYGTTTRRRLVGAADQIDSKLIENRPVGNVTQALQGASPSLNIQQRSMNPNDNTMNINIRGISTMNSNSPLIVIDGLVSESGSLNKLNPNDIESVSVLKDAGTAAIYGSRSSNGVILVTTKKGRKNQRPTLTLSGQVGTQDPEVLFRPVAGYQNATLKNLALTNVNQNPQFSPTQIRDLYENRAEEVWNYDQILQNGAQQTYNVDVAGGGENTTYRFSGGYFDQGSNFVGDGFGVTRYNIRSNVTAEYDRFLFSSILGYTRNNNRATTAGNAIINSSRIPPYYYYRMQAENGRYLVNDALTDQNPLAELNEGGYQTNDNDYFNINLGLDVKIIDGLKIRGVFGADIYSDHRYIRRLQVPLYASAEADRPLVFVNSTRNTEDFNEKAYLLNYQLLLDYDKQFGSHHVTGLFGASNESFTSRRNEIKFRFTDPILGTPIADDSEFDPSSYNSPGGTTESSINSMFGRVGYSFADRYRAEFSFRYDGSSKFPSYNRWGFFPSASLGWSMTEETFLAGYKDRVGDIKLRGSLGLLGNQDIPNYQYFTVYSPFTNVYGFNNSAVSGAGFTYGYDRLQWESTQTLNIGADFSFLNNRLTASLDYFEQKTRDILITPETPTVFGTVLSKMNAGAMRNQGWELAVNYRLTTGAFNHGFGANIGDSWNKVTEFMGDEQIPIVDGIGKITRAGLPFNAYYGYKTNGYFQSMEEIETSALPVGISAADLKPGDVRYVDRNNDGVIDSKDRFVLGTAFPRYNVGFTYDLAVKGFDFSMFWQGVGQRDMMVRGELIEPFHENYSFVIYQHQLDFWTPTNTDATWPRLTAAGASSTRNNYQMGSDLYRFSGSYLRLKNIQVGYSIPAVVTQRFGVQRLRAFVNAQNLITLSKNSWIDPESSEFDSNMSGAANSARNYPTIRYFGFGFDVQF